MDILAHGLWTNVMYRTIPSTRNSRKLILWGVTFGVLPDLVSFSWLLLERFYFVLFAGEPVAFAPANFYSYKTAEFAAVSYNYTHSIIIWLLVLGLVWLMIKKFPWVLLGWGLHILIDIFSHTIDFFATPFLFPLSSFQISVIDWTHPIFMIVNYVLLLVLYLIVLPRTKRS